MKKYIVFDCDGTLVDTSQLRYALYPGIKELLISLSADSLIYVWTARDRRSTLRILDELKILALFEQICTVDDALPKPHISGLQEMVGDFKKSQICVIGDTSNDILGAKNFGVKSVAASWNPSVNAVVMKEAGADFIALKPQDCLEWLTKNIC
ncbi:MAG: HAD family hydrolase [Bdellovibrionales bacterium]|nr:HAD family hydrolase [Bdellovibrionales bacterium]